MFSETAVFNIKIWNNPIETTIYKWLFGVQGTTCFTPLNTDINSDSGFFSDCQIAPFRNGETNHKSKGLIHQRGQIFKHQQI